MPFEELRRKADELLKRDKNTDPSFPSGTVIRLIEEFQSRQAELETRNENLRQALQDLKARLEKEVEEKNAKLHELARALTQAEHQERQRLSALLHDSVQQDLTASKMLAGLMKKMDPGRMKESLDQLAEFLDDSIEKTRTLSAELCPPGLQQGGLEAALKWLIQAMNKKYGLVTELRVEPGFEPVSEFGELLFQTVRELLLNVVKHAQTRQAKIRCARTGSSCLEIRVEDQGKGFDPSDLKENRMSGSGLLRLRQRMSALGGTVELKSSLGAGTSIRLLVPVTAGF